MVAIFSSYLLRVEKHYELYISLSIPTSNYYFPRLHTNANPYSYHMIQSYLQIENTRLRMLEVLNVASALFRHGEMLDRATCNPVNDVKASRISCALLLKWDSDH